MRYRILWTITARDQLASVWLAASDRGAITTATRQIEEQLARNPAGVGESRDETRRVLIEPPLTVIYRINEQQRTVIVLSLRYRAAR